MFSDSNIRSGSTIHLFSVSLFPSVRRISKRFLKNPADFVADCGIFSPVEKSLAAPTFTSTECFPLAFYSSTLQTPQRCCPGNRSPEPFFFFLPPQWTLESYSLLKVIHQGPSWTSTFPLFLARAFRLNFPPLPWSTVFFLGNLSLRKQTVILRVSLNRSFRIGPHTCGPLEEPSP